MMRKLRVYFLPLLLAVLLLAGCGGPEAEQLPAEPGQSVEQSQAPDRDGQPGEEPEESGWQTTEPETGDEYQSTVDQVVFGEYYTTPEDVAEYLHTYEELPPNFLTKQEARDLGWDSSAGNLWEVADGMSIGGDRFGNREGLLPNAQGRTWYECDVNYAGGYRGSERVLWSNDGLIYYTDDHYSSFTRLY